MIDFINLLSFGSGRHQDKGSVCWSSIIFYGLLGTGIAAAVIFALANPALPMVLAGGVVAFTYWPWMVFVASSLFAFGAGMLADLWLNPEGAKSAGWRLFCGYLLTAPLAVLLFPASVIKIMGLSSLAGLGASQLAAYAMAAVASIVALQCLPSWLSFKNGHVLMARISMLLSLALPWTLLAWAVPHVTSATAQFSHAVAEAASALVPWLASVAVSVLHGFVRWRSKARVQHLYKSDGELHALGLSEIRLSQNLVSSMGVVTSSVVTRANDAASQPAPGLDIVPAGQQENFSTFRVNRELLERLASSPTFFGAMVGKMLQNDRSETLTLTVSRPLLETFLTKPSHQQALRTHGIFSRGQPAGKGPTSNQRKLQDARALLADVQDLAAQVLAAFKQAN